MAQKNNPGFPEQSGPDKLHGTTGNESRKEKYLRDGGKIEDYPEADPEHVAHQGQDEHPEGKEKTTTGKKDNNESTHLTDISGEEKKEDYINTDERKMDLDRRGLGNQ